MENVIEIAPVRRESSKLVIGLAGVTGEGKTYSALMLALGLAGMDPTKVGMLDTENRASLNDTVYDSLNLKGDTRFRNGVLRAPFSPHRYIQAMRQFAASGVEALVIDSASHEHEGEGGLEEIAHAPKADGSTRKIADWITAKREHRRFMNTLLYLPCHVIVCFRAREKFDFKNPSAPVSKGMQPITEKNVLFEMTASFMMWNKGLDHEEIKLPEALRPILGQPGYFTHKHGQMLRDWVGGVDPIENAKNALTLAAAQGMASLGEEWGNLPKGAQKTLAGFKDTLKDLAAKADADRLEVKGDDGAPAHQEPTETDPDLF